jgi:hypothetical protein
MVISIVNHTNGQLSDEEVQVGIRAINRQIAHDFEPYWSLGAELRLEGHTAGSEPDKLALPELRGDAVIYLWDKVDVAGALGYHDLNARGIPFGLVFTEISQQLGEAWTVTASHEALELIGDADVNLLVMGPHPQDPTKTVFFWYEMCDAVQAESYKVDGVDVSNFLLPLYFTSDAEEGGRNDFLGRLYDGQALQSFGINPGGYVGFFNPETNQHETFSRKDDKTATKRLAVKGKAAITRRSMRYKYGATPVVEAARAAEPETARARVASTRATRKRPNYQLIDASKDRKE